MLTQNVDATVFFSVQPIHATHHVGVDVREHALWVFGETGHNPAPQVPLKGFIDIRIRTQMCGQAVFRARVHAPTKFHAGLCELLDDWVVRTLRQLRKRVLHRLALLLELRG